MIIVQKTFVLVLMLIAGCQTALNTAKLTTEAVIANEIIESGAPANIIKSANLSESDGELIDDALRYYKTFSDKWLGALKQPLLPGVSMAVLQYDYAELVKHYRNVERIALDHLDDYTDEQIALLSDYRRRAESIDVHVNSLIVQGERNQAIANAIDFGLIILRLAHP